MCDLGATVKLAQLSSLAHFPPHLLAELIFKTLHNPALPGRGTLGFSEKGKG